MGRGEKIGLDYFPLDCYLNEKFQLLEAEYGLRGFAVVIKLFQRIYGVEGYYCKWDKDISLLFAKQVGLTGQGTKGQQVPVAFPVGGSAGVCGDNLIDEIVQCAIRRGIFSEEMYKNYGILTSEGIQKQYLESTKRRKTKKIKKEYLLVKVTQKQKNACKNGINVDINSDNVDGKAIKESKGNKIKLNQNNITVADANKTTDIPSLDDVKNYVVENNLTVDYQKFYWYYSQHGWVTKDRPILNWYLLLHSWIARDRKFEKQQQSGNKNKFHNFEQREYDYDALEKELMS